MKVMLDELLDQITTSDLADWLVASTSCRLGLYADGSVHVGESVGMEIDPKERPVAHVGCPGLGNLDMGWWREGWDCEEFSNEEIIRACCEHGDVEEWMERLRQSLIWSASA